MQNLARGCLIAGTAITDTDWIAKIREIDGNKVKVKLITDHGNRYETWELNDITNKLHNDEYFLIGKCHSEHGNDL